MLDRPRSRNWRPPLAMVAAALLVDRTAQQEPPPELDMMPGLLVNDKLEPFTPYHIKVGIGQAKFMRFTCLGGPADVVITLTTYSLHDDPILFLSSGLQKTPSFAEHDSSSFKHWREDALGGHYAVARAVGPEGGMIGLLNLQHFAAETLDGILSIRCSFVIAFDALFWDHFRDSAVCPVGLAPDSEANGFCSGHGMCGDHGECLCDALFTGPACEYRQSDVTVASFGHYDVDVPTGAYHYFPVRVPRSFPGGYLEVKVRSDRPLVVLVSRKGQPTKGYYEMSNFADWVNQRNESLIRFKVDVATQPQGKALPIEQVGLEPLPPRRVLGQEAACPRLDKLGFLKDDSCHSVPFQKCEGSCVFCIACSRRSAGDGGCTSACEHCTSPHCLGTLASCAGSAPCGLEGTDATPGRECETKCGGCMACVDSSDERCQDCPPCCHSCLPVAAKCDMLPAPQLPPASRSVTVGVFHHRGRNKTLVENANAIVDVTLKADPHYGQKGVPKEFLAYLYNPFHDMRNLAMTQADVYPDGQRFFYTLELDHSSERRSLVRLYNDRMTLLHVVAASEDATDYGMELTFEADRNVSHVLVSSWRSPKTVFDFDQVIVPENGRVHLRAVGKSSLWCAIFASVDGHVNVAARHFREMRPAVLAPVNGKQAGDNIAAVYAISLLAGAAVLLAVCAMMKFKRESVEEPVPAISTIARFSSLVRSFSADESTTALTAPERQLREGGRAYADAARLDRNLEEHYLNRGGIGDDGI